nr:hypothetical protein [Bacteroidales bacterium]
DEALRFTTKLAEQKKKLHALSECGPLSADLQEILANYESLYALTWRNAPPRGNRPRRPALTKEDIVKMSPERREAYERWLKQPRPAELLKMMKANKRYLFLKDIQNVK